MQIVTTITRWSAEKCTFQKKFMHKSKDLTRKVRLDIVAMYDKDTIKKFSALMHSVSLFSDTSASMSWSIIQETIYLAIFWKEKTY